MEHNPHDETVHFDCCDKKYQVGMKVFNVGDSLDVILYCEDHIHKDLPRIVEHEVAAT